MIRIRTAAALLLAAFALQARPERAVPTAWKDWHPPGIDRYALFLEAVFQGDAPAVRAALDSGMTVDWRTATGLSPVLLAAATGRDSITLLVLPHADPGCWPTVAELAIRSNSLGVLEWLDRKARTQGGWNWDSSVRNGTPLAFAIQQGASDTIFEFLLARRGEIDSAEVFRSLDGLCGFTRELTPRQRAWRAHRVLDRWTGHQPGRGGEALHRAVRNLAKCTSDSSLLRRFDIRIDSAERRRLLNGSLASRGRSLQSIDSLLALGADPLAPLGLPASAGSVRKQETPLSWHRTSGYRMEEGPTLAWRTVARFLHHDPARVGPHLARTDSLLIAIATGDLSGVRTWIRTNGTEFAAPGPHRPDPGGFQALALAADAGDTAMTRLLLPLPFSHPQREKALERAVRAHSAAVVRMLLASAIDARLPTRGGKGPVELLHLLFTPHPSRPPDPQDTAIAEMLLEAAYGTVERWPRLPLTRWAMAHPHPAANPVLFDFLWRRHPASMSADTLLVAIGGDRDLLLDTAFLERLGTRGHEQKILEGICQSFERAGNSDPSSIQPDEMMASIALLDTLLARGYPLDSALAPGWICSNGFLEFRFDFRNRRFIPAWRIPSPFSDDAAFDTLDADGYWHPRSDRE